MKLHHRYFPEIMVTFSEWWFLKFSQHVKPFQSLHKVTNSASTDITLMSLLQYLDTFLSTFMYLKS